MFQIIIPVLAGLSVLLLGGAILIARGAKRARIAARLSVDGGTSGVITTAEGSPVIRALNSLGNVTMGGKTSRSLREDLARAGFHSKTSAATYIGAKVVFFAVGLAIAVALQSFMNFSMTRGLALTVLFAAVFFYLPNVFVAVRRRERLTEITCHLPDAIDLLEISVSAGMGMDQAWNAVTDEMRDVCQPLADEMALTNLEMHLGASRPQAMRHMAERTGATDLGSLVACLVQAERFGTSIQDALRNFATAMRETRSQRAQEIAEKMPVKMIFPMVLFIFLPAVMVMAGPAFLTLQNALIGGK
jgi:tight adherence protein C